MTATCNIVAERSAVSCFSSDRGAFGHTDSLEVANQQDAVADGDAEYGDEADERSARLSHRVDCQTNCCNSRSSISNSGWGLDGLVTAACNIVAERSAVSCFSSDRGAFGHIDSLEVANQQDAVADGDAEYGDEADERTEQNIATVGITEATPPTPASGTRMRKRQSSEETPGQARGNARRKRQDRQCEGGNARTGNAKNSNSG